MREWKWGQRSGAWMGARFTRRLPDTLTFTLRLAITTWLGASRKRAHKMRPLTRGSEAWVHEPLRKQVNKHPVKVRFHKGQVQNEEHPQCEDAHNSSGERRQSRWKIRTQVYLEMTTLSKSDRGRQIHDITSTWNLKYDTNEHNYSTKQKLT